MSSIDLRENFNAVSQPQYTCTAARLTYTRHDGVEAQVLEFTGIGADGSAFTERSGPLSGSADVNAAARKVAQTLLDRLKPVA